MAGLIQYLDTDGVRVLTEEIKKRIANVYDIKGSAVYADTAYLADPTHPVAIDSPLRRSNLPIYFPLRNIWA